MHTRLPVGHCECGQPLEFREAVGSGPHREIRCPCGRRHDVELRSPGWTPVAQLTPERSVPLSGFSKDLRLASDAERYWFPFALRGEVSLPVHMVFSPSARTAELKAADLKAYHLDDVVSATDARRRWIAWWQSMQRPHRSRGPSPIVPRRLGRLPVSRLQTARASAH
jgi:hypothetical protein